MTVTRTGFDDAALRAWWQDAYANGGLRINTFFQSWAWNASWWECFGAADPSRELFLLKGERAGGIVFAAPFFLQRSRVGQWTAWERLLWIADELSPYPDLVTTCDDVVSTWDAILAFVRRARPQAWFQLADVFASSTLATYSTGEARMESRPGSVCLRLAFPAGGGAVDELVRPEFRRTLAKALRGAACTPGLAWEAVQAPDAALRAQLADLNLQRFDARSFFSSATNAAFFDTLGRAEQGEAMSTVLSVHGMPRHMIYGYYHADIFYYFLSGMTNAQGGPEAPGFANFSSLFASLMERGARRFDFLRGTERYKRDLGGSPVESVHRTLIPRAAELPYRLSRAARGAKSALQRLPARAEGHS